MTFRPSLYISVHYMEGITRRFVILPMAIFCMTIGVFIKSQGLKIIVKAHIWSYIRRKAYKETSEASEASEAYIIFYKFLLILAGSPCPNKIIYISMAAAINILRFSAIRGFCWKTNTISKYKTTPIITECNTIIRPRSIVFVFKSIVSII
jgi:hypothetical protein